MRARRGFTVFVAALLIAGAAEAGGELDRDLARVLRSTGFTGRVEATLQGRLGRPLDSRLVDLGRKLFFDSALGLHEDNSCAGCHSPASGFGDSQSIAIGVDNNGIVGPRRAGARNQRKAPPVINSVFYPKLMLNGRFQAISGDPFDNSSGFRFPDPEGVVRFPPNDPAVRTLLAAQGHIPSTELVEMAGFTGTAGTIAPEFDAFDDGHGTAIPAPDASGFRNEPIRQAVLERIVAIPEYRESFGAIFEGEVRFEMVGQALAEFQTSLTFANAPIDRFARGEPGAMTVPEKRGALLFFGKAGCVRCHAVSGAANEMFSDFENHVLAVPQLATTFGVGSGSVVFDGPERDEDFGAEQVTGDPVDRYAFRTSPLRNVAVQPAFFHDGAFTRLRDAVRHHLDAIASVRDYDPVRAGVDRELTFRPAAMQPVLERLDPRLREPLDLSGAEFEDLVQFVRDGLLDPRARPRALCALVPDVVPSGARVARFEGCSTVP